MKDLKEKILEAVNFTAFFNEYNRQFGVDALRPKSDGWVNELYNPFYSQDNQNNKSFSVNLNTGKWKDFGTSNHKDSGDFFNFVEEFNKIDFKQALIFLAEKFGIPVATQQKKVYGDYSDKQVEKMTNNLLRDEKFAPLREYLSKAGISDETIKKYKVGADNGYVYEEIEKDEKVQKDSKGNILKEKVYYPFIIFFYGKNDIWKKVYFKDGKKSKPRTHNLKSDSGFALFPNQPKKNETLYICAGERDCLGLIEMGYNAVTYAYGEGSSFKPSLLQKILSFNSVRIILLYDNDVAGIKGAEIKANQFYNYINVKTILWTNLNKPEIENKLTKRYKIFDKFDFTDFYIDGGNEKDLEVLIKETEYYEPFAEKQMRLIKDGKANEIRESLKETFYYGDNLKLDIRAVYEHLLEVFDVCFTKRGNRKVMYLYNDGIWKETEPEIIEKYLDKILFVSPTISQINEIFRKLKAETFIEADKLNSYLHLIPLKNCCYDLKNFEELPHSKEHYFTFKNTYDYVPDAKKPELFLKLINDYSLGDEDWKLAMQEIMGYCLTGENLTQQMFWWHGEKGGNGKSTILTLLDKLVGEELTFPELAANKLDDKFILQGLQGKRLAYDGDSKAYLDNGTIIKKLTGGDKIRSDVKYGDSVSFENKAKIIYNMNTPPTLPHNESIEPYLRRIHYLSWDYKITKADFTIQDRLQEELSGIFNWAVEGLRRLRKNKKITVPKKSKEWKHIYKGEANTFLKFIETEVVERDGFLWANQMWKAYCEFMNKNAGVNWSLDRKNVQNAIKFGKLINSYYDFIDTKENVKAVDIHDYTKSLKNTEGKLYKFCSYDADYKSKDTVYFGISLKSNIDYMQEITFINSDDKTPF